MVDGHSRLTVVSVDRVCLIISQNKLNILLFHSQSLSSFPSGEYHVAVFESRELERYGINTRLIEFKTSKSLLSHISPSLDGILKNLWSWPAYNAIKTSIQTFNPDIVHFHGLFPYLSASALAAAHECGVAVVQTLHNGRWLCLEGGFYRDGRYCDVCTSRGGWHGVIHGCKHGVVPSLFLHGANLTGLIGGRLFRWVDRFIAVSDFIRDQHVRAGFPSEKIVVKPNGFDVGSLQKLRRPHHREGIVFVGRISTAKGAAVLQALMAKIKATVHIVGDGPDLDELKHYCANSGFTHVQFWGKQPQNRCFELMASARCTIVPSQCGEAFSLVCVESMGLGTPVVASDVGGLGPLIKASGGGIVVDPCDLDGFITAVQTLLEQPDKAVALGSRGEDYVRRHLNMEVNMRELIGIYESVLDDKRRHDHQL